MFIIEKAKKRTAMGNKGASLITVIISMFFITTLGGTVLHLAYTSFLIATTQEKSTTHSYSTKELVEFIRAGIQNVVSDSAYNAYEHTLTNYNNSAEFREIFSNEVLTWKENTIEFDGQQLTNINGIDLYGDYTYTYNLQVIANFLVAAGVNKSDIYIDGISDTSQNNAPIHLSTTLKNGQTSTMPVGTVEYSSEKIIFKDINIVYKNAQNNIQKTISTDIAITIPPYFDNFNGDVSIDFLSVSDYSIIASENLSLNSSNINSNVFANTIVLAGGGKTEINDTIITPNDLEIPSGYIFNMRDGAELWARNIELQNGAMLTSANNSSIFVQNDLNMSGANSVAVINGDYYGFSNSATNPLLSSSIIINGLNCTFDVTNAQTIMLAGSSFVVESESELTNSGVLMGESISARPNQLAYLLPESLLPANITSNPCIMPISEPTPSIDDINTSAPVLFKSTLDNYGATVKTLAYSLPGTNNKAIYFFINFDSASSANAYFKDYFTLNGAEITKYLDIYTTLGEHNGNVQTQGYVIQKTSDGQYALPEINSAPESTANYLQTVYKRLCTSLSNNDTAAISPYNYIINEEALKKFTGTLQNNVFEFNDTNNNTLALFVDNDTFTPFVLNSGEYENVSLIISSGDVTINSMFSGLILSGGNVTIATNGSISSDSASVIKALNAMHENGTAAKHLFTDAHNIAASGEINTSETQNITDFVQYENMSTM